MVAKEINGTVYRGSTIIVSADIVNGSGIDFTPDNPLNVTITAKRNSGTVFDSQAVMVICPKNDKNLVWFKIEIPESGYSNNNLAFTFTVATPADVTDSNASNNTSSESATATVLPTRSTPDTSLELEVLGSFNNSTYKTRNENSLNWSVWEWSGTFVKKTYNAKYTVTAALTPDDTAVWKQYNNSTKLWSTRSGYGLNTSLTVSLPSLSSDMYADNLKVNAYYPEFNYTTSASSSDMLDRTSGMMFNFKSDSNSISGGRMHKTPVWFSDGEYSVRYYIYDIWTPAGMLTGNNYALINIEGSMYDAKPTCWLSILSVIKAAIFIYLIYLSVYDILYKKVSDISLILMLPVIIIHCTVDCCINHWAAVLPMILGAIAGGGILLIAAIITHSGIGGGDIKLAALLSFTTGLTGMTVMLTTASLAAVAYGAIKCIRSKDKAIRLAFIPFMTFGYLVSAIFQ